MTWFLAECCQLLAVAVSIRYSFKILGKLSHSSGKTVEQAAAQILKFWVLFSFLRIFEFYLEYFIRWFPFFFYFKAFLFLLICIPELKISHLIFNDVLIPSIDRLQHHVLNEDGAAPTPVEIYMSLATALLVIVNPCLLSGPNRRRFPASESDSSIRSDSISDSEVGGDNVVEAEWEDNTGDGDVDGAGSEEKEDGSAQGMVRAVSEEFFIEDIYDEYESSVPPSTTSSVLVSDDEIEEEAATTPFVSPWRSSLNRRHRNISLRKRSSGRLSAGSDLDDELSSGLGASASPNIGESPLVDGERPTGENEGMEADSLESTPQRLPIAPATPSSVARSTPAHKQEHDSKRSSMGSDFGSPFLPSPTTVFGGPGGALRTARRLSQLSQPFRRLTAAAVAPDSPSMSAGATPSSHVTPERVRGGELSVPSSGELFSISECDGGLTELRAEPPNNVAPTGPSGGHICATRRVSYSCASQAPLGGKPTSVARVSLGGGRGVIVAERGTTAPSFGAPSRRPPPPVPKDFTVRPSVSSRLSKTLRKLSPIRSGSESAESAGSGWRSSIFDFDIHKPSANTASRRKSVMSLKKKL